MRDLCIDKELIRDFEQALNPFQPEAHPIKNKIIGYGEMTTIIEIGDSDLAYKRMPMFKSAREASEYTDLHNAYTKHLEQDIGVNVLSTKTEVLSNSVKVPTVYIAQEKLSKHSIVNKALHTLNTRSALLVLNAIFGEIKKVYQYNRDNEDGLEFAIDGQASNWALTPYKGEVEVPYDFKLFYLDTSTPLIRKNGIEQLDTELFLRSAPSFLVWVIRLFFVKDVVNRYYDMRKVYIDLLANLYKEKKADLIPEALSRANAHLLEFMPNAKLIDESEVKAYYKEDAFIWRFYLAARKVDRFLHRLIGKTYPYILPKKIVR